MKLAACVLSLALAAPLVAHAAPAGDLATRIPVRYADLDLSQPRGATTLLKRLDRAAMSACGASEFSLREVRRAVRGSPCYRDSLDRAVADVGAPALTALHR